MRGSGSAWGAPRGGAPAWGAAVAPGLLDGVLQVAGAVLHTEAVNDQAHTWLPVGLERYWIAHEAAPPALWARARPRPQADTRHANVASMTFDVQAFDADGTPWAEFRGLEVQRTPRALLAAMVQATAKDEATWAPRQGPELARTIGWMPIETDELGSADAAPRRWLIVADEAASALRWLRSSSPLVMWQR